MPLTPEEQAELDQLEKQFGGLTPEEAKELEELEKRFGGLTPEEAEELAQLEAQFGEQEAPGKLEALARGAAQGATFGFADELTGAVESAFSDKTYEQARDESRAAYSAAQEAHPVLSAVGEISGGIGMMFVPGFGWLKAGESLKQATKVGAIAGGIYGAGKSKELSDVPKDVATGAALGAATTAAVGSLFKWMAKAKDPEVAKHVADRAQIALETGEELSENMINNAEKYATSKTGRDVYARAMDQLEKTAAPMPPMAQAVKDKKFVRMVIGKKATEKLESADYAKAKDMLTSQGEERSQQLWNSYQTKLAYEKITVDVADEFREVGDISKLGGLSANLKDPGIIFKQLDDDHGFNLSGAFYQVHKAINKASDEVNNLIGAAEKSFQHLTKKNTDEAIEFIQKYESGQGGPEAKYVKELFDTAYNRFKELGYNIKYRENYIPHIQARPSDMRKLLVGKIRRVNNLSDDPEIIKALEFLNTKQIPIKTKDEAIKFVDDMVRASQKDMTNLGEAGALFGRTEGLPIYLRELNLVKAYTRHVNALSNMTYLRDPIQDLSNQAYVLNGIDGFGNAAKYVEGYIANLKGRMGVTSAAWESGKVAWRAAVDKAFPDISKMSPFKQTAVETLEHAPDFLDFAMNSIYPNVMGLNPAAALRNLSQTWFLTAPELRGKYGYNTVTHAWKQMFKDKVNGVDMQKALKDRGLASDHQVFEGVAADLADGIRSIPGIGKAVQSIDKLNKYAMYLYTKSDTANRYIAMKAGDKAAEDILNKSTGALKFLESMTPAMKQQAIAAMKNKDLAKLKDIMADHLVIRTQFVYGKEGLNQLGRNYGKLVSMFTKWPVNIASEAQNLIYTKDQQKFIGKMLTPLALTLAPHYMLEQMNFFDDPKTKILFGRGFTRWAPITSPMQISLPPPVEVVNSLGQAVLQDAANGNFAKGLEHTAKSIGKFVPVFGLGQVNYYRHKGLIKEEDK